MQQINVVEAESVVKGLGELCRYTEKGDTVRIVVDSKTSQAWVRKALNGDILRCRSMSSVLLMRRLEIISGLVEGLSMVSVDWVASSENHADELTRVASRWMEAWRGPRETADAPAVVVGAVVQSPVGLSERFRSWQHANWAAVSQTRGVMVDGLLCLRHGSRRGVYLPVVISPYLREYLELRHIELGHIGVVGLWYTVREEASFPEGKLSESIRDVLRTCDVCTRKQKNQYLGSQGAAWGRFPGDETFLDCLTLSGDKYKGLIAAVDSFSRFAETKPVTTFDSDNTMQFLDELTSRYGAPRVLRVDHGREFDNGGVRAWCRAHGVQLQFSSVANPRSQSIVERFNRTILGILRAMAADENRPWHELLPRAMEKYNGRVHKSLGWEAPRNVFLGRVDRRHSIDEERDWDAERSDLYNNLDWEFIEDEIDPKFRAGEAVHLRKQRAKEMFHDEPARVERPVGNRAYVVETASGKRKTVHESSLKPRRTSENELRVAESEIQDESGGDPDNAGYISCASSESVEISTDYGAKRVEDVLHVNRQDNSEILSCEKNFDSSLDENIRISQPVKPTEESSMPRRSARKPKPNRKFDQ